MKFSCGRCGKKYATAETPAPGRVYKIKCKACGHLIVVKASAAAQQTATTELRASTSTDLAAVAPAQPASPDGQGLNLEIAAPEPHAGAAPPVPGLEPLPPEPPPSAFVEAPAPTPAPVNGARTNGAPAGIPQHPDETQEISVASLQPAATPPPAPSADGYVDLFGGAEPPRLDAPAPPEAPPAPPEVPAPPPPVEDPFLAAARASLPDGYGKTAGAPDPFGPLKTPPPEPLPSAASAAPKVPVIAKPAQERSSAPFVLIGVGGLVLVGILAFVLLGGQKAPAPPAPPAVAVAPAAAPVAPAPSPPAPAPVAQPAPPPVEATPAPARAEKPEKRATSDDDRRARDERRAQEREAKAAREREAKEAREREKAAREAKAREDRDAREREKARVRAEREASARDRERQEQEKVAAAGLGEAEGGLSQDQVQKVLSSTRKAFEGCIVNAGKSGAVQLDGRRVMLRLNIQTNGAVTYPTLDDVTLNGTDLGSCLKSAARIMVFPKFKGDTMHVEVPLVLAGGR